MMLNLEISTDEFEDFNWDVEFILKEDFEEIGDDDEFPDHLHLEDVEAFVH